MGNNQSLSLEERQSYIQQNLHFVKQVENDAYGEVKIMKNELNQDIFAVKQYSFQDREKLDNFIKRTERRKQLVSPSIAELIDVEANKAEDFCSKFYKLSLVYQYHPENLQQLIDKRKKLKKRFSEQEIFLLIDCISSALLVFDSLDLKHEDIRPQTILISWDNKYKLTDIKFLTQFSQYKRLLIGVSDTNYLSPILFQQMEHRIANPENNEVLSDIFSLGLVCLEMASLRSIQGIYDWEKYLISEERVEKLIFQLKEDGYSETLIELILRMLQIEENDRITPHELLQCLEPMREQYQNIKLLYTTTRFGDRSQIYDHSQNPNSYLSHSQYNSPDNQSVIVRNYSTLLSRKPSFNQTNQTNTQREVLEQQIIPPSILEKTQNISQIQERNYSKSNIASPRYKENSMEDKKKNTKRNLELDENIINEQSEIEKQIYQEKQQQNRQNEQEQQHQEEQIPQKLNSNFISEDVQEYWEQSLHYLDQDVENVLNETSRLQQQYNKIPKLNLDESEIDNLITKRLELKNDSIMNNMYQHKHSSTLTNPQPLSVLSSSNLHNSSQNKSKMSKQGNNSKHFLHSDTRSLSQTKLSFTQNNTRQNSPKQQQNQDQNYQKAIPLQQDYIDKSQGNNNLYDIYLNEYKKLVNTQNKQNSNPQYPNRIANPSYNSKY